MTVIIKEPVLYHALLSTKWVDLCGGAHEISGIPAPLWLCGWVVERIMEWVGGGYVGCGGGGWVGGGDVGSGLVFGGNVDDGGWVGGDDVGGWVGVGDVSGGGVGMGG